MNDLSDSRPLCEEQAAPSKERQASTSRRRRFTLKLLMLAIAVAAILPALWVSLSRNVLNVRAATASDPVQEWYFALDAQDAHIRNVAVVRGAFTTNTRLSVSLFAVQSGTITEVSQFTLMRSPNQLFGRIRERLTIYLALGSWDSANGRITQLGSAGQSRAGGWRSELPISIPNKYCDSFRGSITPGRTYLIYAEGNTQIQLDAHLTIEEFSKRHSGDYLVVTARLH